jgi:hypothetical protein
VTGAIYYWKSTVSANGTGGQIWRKSFGDTNAEEQITNTGGLGGTCFGCHQLSRDGKRMTINADDDDSDDEYGDVQSALIDVATKMYLGGTDPNAFTGMGQPAGFQTFSPDHTVYLGSSGDGTGMNSAGGGTGLSNGFFAWNGDTGANLMPVTAAAAGKRPTMPDWSPDGKNLVYVVPDHIGDSSYTDDDHVFGGSLWTMPNMGMSVFGMPTVLLQSAGENNYYPSFSPDGQFVIFDRVAKQTSTAVAASDSFANPNARVFVLPYGQMSMTPIDCALLNGTGSLSNSWPRWSPFIQTYRGSKLLWVTFSSTRDYGVQIQNQGGGKIQCYPPDDVENPPPNDSHGMPFPSNCMQPQIWMAAINLTTAGEFTNPSDPSYPAFWLPFQDPTTHNHTAQWTTTIVTPSPTPGPCIPANTDCTKDPNNCCIGICIGGTGQCGIP